LRFFSCKENSFILFRDLFAFGNITKKQIEFINKKFPPEKVKEFLQKIQEERQAKKIPAVLQNIIYKYIIQYYTILLSRYSILLTLDEPESEGMICEYREDDFSIWYCEVSGNTFLNI